jgi:hypothetical protein
VNVKLDDTDLEEINAIRPIGTVSGTRYPDSLMASVNR